MGNSSSNVRAKHLSGGGFSPAQCKLVLADDDDATRRNVVLELQVTGAASRGANGIYRLCEQQVTYQINGDVRRGPQWQSLESPSWRIRVGAAPRAIIERYNAVAGIGERSSAAGAGADSGAGLDSGADAKDAGSASDDDSAGDTGGRRGSGGAGSAAGAAEVLAWFITKTGMGGGTTERYYSCAAAEDAAPTMHYRGGHGLAPPVKGWRSGGEDDVLGVGEPCDATLEVCNARGSMRNINLGLPALQTGYLDDKLSEHKGLREPASA